MSNLVEFDPSRNVANALRNIANKIDNGELSGKTAALVVDCEVFMCGDVLDRYAAQEAVWHFQYGIHKLMDAATGQ